MCWPNSIFARSRTTQNIEKTGALALVIELKEPRKQPGDPNKYPNDWFRRKRPKKEAAMTFIKTIPEEQAEGHLKEHYEAARKAKGYVPNYIKAFSLHPEVYDAWTKLQGAIRSNMRLRRYELVTFATAMVLDCSY
jgi:hypothetical protein